MNKEESIITIGQKDDVVLSSVKIAQGSTTTDLSLLIAQLNYVLDKVKNEYARLLSKNRIETGGELDENT